MILERRDIMKKILINIYVITMLIFYLIYNIVLNNLKIGGLLYRNIMLAIIIVNTIILILYKKEIRFKSVLIMIYFFTWFFISKNIFQCAFGFSNMIVLLATGYNENNFNKTISILISLFYILCSPLIYFIFLLAYGTSLNEETERNDIYDDMHYYCENNYEVYTYSGGAMDSFHYSIGKYYDILDIDGIIYISYNERNEVSKKKYDIYLKKHKCRLVSDINGSN